jgi:hypothetical protein
MRLVTWLSYELLCISYDVFTVHFLLHSTCWPYVRTIMSSYSTSYSGDHDCVQWKSVWSRHFFIFFCGHDLHQGKFIRSSAETMKSSKSTTYVASIGRVAGHEDLRTISTFLSTDNKKLKSSILIEIQVTDFLEISGPVFCMQSLA